MILHFIVLALACARLSMMMSSVGEAGPANLLHKLRYLIGVRYDEEGEAYGTNWVADGSLCIRCVSVWVGFVLTIIYMISGAWSQLIALPFALSMLAIFVKENYVE